MNYQRSINSSKTTTYQIIPLYILGFLCNELYFILLKLFTIMKLLWRINMKYLISLFVFIFILSFSLQAQNAKIKYPVAKKTDQIDDYFGTKISDPYRWLENTQSAETKEWIKAENKLTQYYS